MDCNYVSESRNGRNLQELGSSQDDALLALIQRGDVTAMSRFFDLHAKAIYSIALDVLRDPQEAEDVLQEMLLRVWRTPASLARFGPSLCNYLAYLTKDLSIHTQRKRHPHIGRQPDAVCVPNPHNLTV